MWKKILLGIGVVIVVAIALALFFTKSLSEVANNHLAALRAGDIQKAYSYTSQAFQTSTSLDAFTQFVNKYSFLKNNKSASWSSREIANNVGTLNGTLTANDGGVTPVVFHFVRENSEWKILNMTIPQPGAAAVTQAPSQAQQPTTAVDTSQGELYRILISDVQNPAGNVEQGKPIIPRSAPKVFVSVYIVNAKAGLKVVAEFVRLANGAKIGPSEATVTQNGNIIRDFSFTNTQATWPPGDYVINVATSAGQKAAVRFKIN